MTTISQRQPEVCVEYNDAKGNRKSKHFTATYKAKRWYTIQDKLGRDPKVLKPSNTTIKVVACYVRVSTVGQNEAGQRVEIERWLTGNGIDLGTVRWYVDKKSGDNLERSAFEELQRAIFAGEVSTVVVWKLDRLSRKLRDGINTLCDWVDKGLRVVSVTQQIDFNGTVGKIIGSVLLGIAEMEQENRRERQRVGIDVAKKAGRYKRCGRKKGTTKAKPTRAIQLHKKGWTPSEIARAMGVSRNTVHRYLRQAQS